MSSLFCKIGFHNWSYYNDKKFIDPSIHKLPKTGIIYLSAHMRICKICMKKYSKYYSNGAWEIEDFSKLENREFQLRKLLGNSNK